MANPEHLGVLQDALAKKDISIWNKWLKKQRKADPFFSPDLSEADLKRAKLSQAILVGANFSRANLIGADFVRADLRGANFSGADLLKSNFLHANIIGGVFSHANLRYANLKAAIFRFVDLQGADLNKAHMGFYRYGDAMTILSGLDLSSIKGLETVQHHGPSSIGIDTIYRSHGNIPEIFLRGCGVPDTMITFAKSLVGQAIEYYSAFISYSTADEHFARRLHNDLQANGVRVWFAPEDLKIGDPIKQRIDESIKLYDKLILVLSQNSINRAWVRHEVERALEKEKQHHKLVLFPIRLDDSVFHTTEQWAYDIRERHIGDFTKWDNPIVYQGVMNRLLRDLNAKS